jgi:membrane fusion protein, multidrug efflux system
MTNPPDAAITRIPETSRSATTWRGRGMIATIVLMAAAGLLAFLWSHQPSGDTRSTSTSASATGGRGGGAPANATLVTVENVTQGPMSIYLDALGTVTPEHTANVYSQVGGRIDAVHYREGQLVKKGQPLVDIDPRPYQAQLTQAQGALARDRAILDQARVNLTRYREAFDRNKAVSEQQVSDQQAAVRQAEGTVQNDEGTVKYDEVQLAYTHILAPFDGRIGLRLVDPGNTVFANSNTALAVITQIDPITIVFSVAEDHLTQVQTQLRAGKTLLVDIYDRTQAQKLATGTLLALDNEVDTTTGTVKFRAHVKNPGGTLLFPNQFVNTRLRVDTIDKATQVPTAAIQYNGSQAFVYVVQPNHAAVVRKITVSNSEGNKSAVDGVKPGESIVTSNFDRLRDGATVMVRGAAGNGGARGGRS